MIKLSYTEFDIWRWNVAVLTSIYSSINFIYVLSFFVWTYTCMYVCIYLSITYACTFYLSVVCPSLSVTGIEVYFMAFFLCDMHSLWLWQLLLWSVTGHALLAPSLTLLGSVNFPPVISGFLTLSDSHTVSVLSFQMYFFSTVYLRCICADVYNSFLCTVE